VTERWETGATGAAASAGSVLAAGAGGAVQPDNMAATIIAAVAAPEWNATRPAHARRTAASVVSTRENMPYP